MQSHLSLALQRQTPATFLVDPRATCVLDRLLKQYGNPIDGTHQVLVIAEFGALKDFVIHCRSCKSYNVASI